MNNNVILPNFLIAGMAKCGTSSLSRYIQQHPDVFISELKEPRFITSQVMDFPMNGPKDDKVEAWYVKKYEDYLKLFENATEKAIGEASADTLYFYKGAIPTIKKYFGDPKIILILRDPVKRAFSAYQHLVRDERESLSFEEALTQEPNRVKDNWELIYHYTEVSKYYEPVKAFLENFSQVKVITNEELSKTPEPILKEVFEFLEVDPAFSVDTSMRFNTSGVPKSQFLHNFLWEENPLRKIVRPIVRTVLPSKEQREKLTNQLMRRNLDRLSIEAPTKQKLTEMFQDDTQKLQDLLQRDFSTVWYK